MVRGSNEHNNVKYPAIFRRTKKIVMVISYESELGADSKRFHLSLVQKQKITFYQSCCSVFMRLFETGIPTASKRDGYW